MPVDSGIGTDSSLALTGGSPVRQSWLPYGQQTIEDTDIDAVARALRSDWLTQGPKIPEFEEEFATVCGAQYAVAFNSGTAALHAAYFAAGVSRDDEIITSAMTFAATANAAVYLGATPCFADIEKETGNIDCKTVTRWIGPRTRAVIGIDYAGQPCDAEKLKEAARAADVPLIIDAAHSLGGSYKGKPVGSLADMTTFSFHPVKAITTGEGGMVVTDDHGYAEKLRLFRTHGIEKNAGKFERENKEPWYHEMQVLGYNYRLTDFQAALGLAQLKRLQIFIDRRRALAARYRDGLTSFQQFSPLMEHKHVSSAYHLFPVLINEDSPLERDFVVRALHAENIGVQLHYIPTYSHPFHEKIARHDWKALCPNTESFSKRVLSLPIFPSMKDEDVDSVLSALRKVEKHKA